MWRVNRVRGAFEPRQRRGKAKEEEEEPQERQISRRSGFPKKTGPFGSVSASLEHACAGEVFLFVTSCHSEPEKNLAT